MRRGIAAAAVSILVRPGGRTLRRRSELLRSDSKVSILVRPVGRTLRAPPPHNVQSSSCFNPRPTRRSDATARGGVVRQDRRVSILVRPGGRTLRWPGRRIGRTRMFQSSSDPEVGRYSAPAVDLDPAAAFQSSSDPEVGRYRSTRSCSTSSPSFNPRPTRRSDATCAPAAAR